MDELTLFSDLCPTDDIVPEHELVTLRSELFPLQPRPSQPTSPAGALLHLEDARTARAPARRTWWMAAAATVLAVAVGSWSVVERNPRSTSTKSESPAVVAPPTEISAEPIQPSWTTESAGGDSTDASVDSGFDRPRFVLGEPGWAMTYASENTSGQGQAIVFLTAAGFDGAWVSIAFAVQQAGELPVRQLGDITAHVSEFEGGALVYWTEPGGRQLTAYAWQTDAAGITAVVEAATVTAGHIEVPTLPAGASLATPTAAEALGDYGSYSFTNTDGRTLDLTIVGGASRGVYQSVGPGSVIQQAHGETWSVVDFDGGGTGQPPELRASVRRGFWAWTFTGQGFASRSTLLDTAATVQQVDEKTWEGALPADFVASSTQSAVVAELLGDVPLPDGFDEASLADGTTNDRYQFIARVSGAVVCAWMNQWFTAVDAGDTERQAEAAAALATSRDWAMLLEIADQGGFAQIVWSQADHVNGGQPVGAPATDRSELSGTFGCAL